MAAPAREKETSRKWFVRDRARGVISIDISNGRVRGDLLNRGRSERGSPGS